MFRLVKQMYPSLKLDGKKCIIRARDWLLFLEGRALLNECQAAVKNAETFIDDVYTKEKERGYQEGLEQARTDMAGEQVRFSRHLESHFKDVEDDITMLVCNLVEKIVGSIDEQERVIKMIQKAIANLKTQERVRVSVRPEYVEAVYKNITEVYRNYSAPGSITVEPNSNLVGDQCIVEAGGLVIEISLASHVEVLKRSLKIPVPQ